MKPEYSCVKYVITNIRMQSVQKPSDAIGTMPVPRSTQ
jgi:hypothetical protein